MSVSDPCLLSARELAAQLRAGRLSAVETMSAHLDRIDRLDPQLGAICTRLPREGLLARAAEADARRSRGEALGPLHGLPMAVKDLVETRGIRTTFGSTIFADYVPRRNALLVDRLESAGAIVLGKTNVPEFGAGSQTFNEVFGPTRNPWDPTRTPGGSSGGAAAALAARMVPLADGSDMGGSLRNPAAFCGVVGFRPSLGRVPTWPSDTRHLPRLSIDGPMARSVADAALLLSVLAGADARDPQSWGEAPSALAEPLDRDVRGLRAAWGGDLGGMAVAREVMRVCREALPVFESLGFQLTERAPDLAGAMDAFQVQRALHFAALGSRIPAAQRDRLKDTVRWNFEKGMALTAEEILAAERARGRIVDEVATFFEAVDVLLLPTTQVAPFPIETEWVREIEGRVMPTYIDWMESCCAISVTGLPAISVPCGFTDAGLPVGLQIVGGPRRDRLVLEVAHAYESATPWKDRLPALAAA